MEFLVAVLFHIIIAVALGVCQNGTEALYLQVENELVEIPRFLHECVFDKQEVAWQWHEFHFAEMFQKKVVDAVFRRMAHLNVVATAFQFFL